MTLYTNIIKKNKVNNSVIKKYTAENFENTDFSVKVEIKEEKESINSLPDIRKEEEILDSARKKAEDIKNKAKNDGYEEGFEQGTTLGYEAGFNKALEDIQAQKEGVTELLMQAEVERKKMLSNIEDDVIEMVMSIAEKVTKISIEDNYEKILPMIKYALNDMVNRERIILKANSKNMEILKNNEKQLKSICPSANFTFLEDNTLDTTECIIDSETETIDLDIQTQISNILKEFAKVR
ncbi:hypothetical protein SH2C18_11970 [Clostridium sediminicola]